MEVRAVFSYCVFVIACLLLPRDNRCVYMTHVCFYVYCGDCVGVCAKVLKIVPFIFGVLKYVVSLCRGYDGC